MAVMYRCRLDPIISRRAASATSPNAFRRPSAFSSLVRMANSTTTSEAQGVVSVSALPYVCVVRHGETIRTITGQHTGRTDIPLTERGEVQANALSARLRDMRFSDVFTSPLQRARRTCELAGFGAIAAADGELVEGEYGEDAGQGTVETRAGRAAGHRLDVGRPTHST